MCVPGSRKLSVPLQLLGVPCGGVHGAPGKPTPAQRLWVAGRAGHSCCFPRERGVGVGVAGGWGVAGGARGTREGSSSRSPDPCGFAARGLTEAPHPHPQSPSSRESHSPPRTDQHGSLSDPIVPTHAAPQRPVHPHQPTPAPHTSPRAALAIPPSGTPAARPRRAKKALGHRSGGARGARANWRPREQ